MAPLTLSAEAKATMCANLELELKNRREKLLAMCDAQVASLRSRLERRVNRVPLKLRKTKLITLIEANNASVLKSILTEEADKSSQMQDSAPAPMMRKTRAAPATKHAPRPTPMEVTKTSTKSAPKIAHVSKPVSAPKSVPAPKTSHTSRTTYASRTTPVEAPKVVSKTRGVKRSSNEISTDDKENANGDLQVPKKRTKAAPLPMAPAPATRATRTTRAASSRKVAPSAQILSPKTNNARPAPQTRTRRQR